MYPSIVVVWGFFFDAVGATADGPSGKALCGCRDRAFGNFFALKSPFFCLFVLKIVSVKTELLVVDSGWFL